MSRSSGSVRATPRRKSRQDDDFIYDCKAAYHVVFDDVDDEIGSKDELAEVLQQSGRNPTRKMLYKYWKGKTITFEEFCDICAEIPTTSTDDLLKAFKKVDLNGDGYISNSELRRMLTSKGEKMTESEVAAIIEEVDENGDGKLDYKEFCKMLLSTQDEVKKLGAEKLERKRKGKNYRKDDDDLRISNKPVQSPKAKPRQLENKRGIKEDFRRVPEKHDSEPEMKPGSETDSDSDLIVVPKYTKKSLIQTAPAASSHWATGKPPKPRPRPRAFKTADDEDEPSPRDHGGKSRSTNQKLSKPKRLKDWQEQSTKGCFLFEDDGSIVTHHYKLELPEDSSMWITIQPNKLDEDRHRDTPTDTMLYVLRDDNTLVTFTEQRDDHGKYGVRCDLESGRYKLIPFTTGCHLKRRRDERDDGVKLIKKNKEGDIVLTKQFRETLTEIFHLSDLDGDGLLNREEFGMYNLRVSGEEVSDEEWAVVEDNVHLKDDKLTLEGFLKLNQMEAEDTQGDPEELWVTLSSWGYNKSLKQDEGCPYLIEVYAEECNVELSVAGLKAGGRSLETAVIESTKGHRETRKVKGMRDVFIHTYQTDYRACLVVENKSQSRVSVTLDCSRSKNCISNRKRLNYTLDVPSKSVVVGLHLMPQNDSKEWVLNVQESVD